MTPASGRLLLTPGTPVGVTSSCHLQSRSFTQPDLYTSVLVLAEREGTLHVLPARYFNSHARRAGYACLPAASPRFQLILRAQIHVGFAVHQPSQTSRYTILASALERYDTFIRIGTCSQCKTDTFTERRHATCSLTTWLAHSKKKSCDVCKHSYSFTKGALGPGNTWSTLTCFQYIR